jgi:hypothetical protein
MYRLRQDGLLESAQGRQGLLESKREQETEVGEWMRSIGVGGR